MLGIVIVLSPVTLLNAFLVILVKLAGIVMLSRFAQPVKAYSPTAVTPFSIVTSVRDAQLTNALALTVETVDGIVMLSARVFPL